MTRVKPLFGPTAILADGRPLDPHVTVRLANAADAACECGRAATLVLLGVDRAAAAPHFPELEDRVCHAWFSVFQTVCEMHSELAIRALCDDVRARSATTVDAR